MNPYHAFVSQFASLLDQGRQAPLGTAVPSPRPTPAATAPRALIFSPHPDDEVIIGAWPLRLLRQSGMNVLNVAVTQGSNKDRQAERWQELSRCCQHIGFGLIQTRPQGLEGINPKTRTQDPAAWGQAVNRIAEILTAEKPRAIFFPHDRDWNSTHIGTHYLVADALKQTGNGFRCWTVETEFWGAMDDPNVMVESSVQDVIDLISALTFHIGEVQRNPYHLRLPALMIDNVRRGGELVGGQGGAAPDYTFSTLYRLRRWEAGEFKAALTGGRLLPASEDPASLLVDL